MIKNLPDEIYQLESEHAKGDKRHTNTILELEGEKSFKTYFNVLERQYGKSKNF